MKRRFSLILAVVLALALVAVIPFATTAFDTETTIGDVETGYTPEGTAVTTPEEFAAMTADGSYYLANNITISATYVKDFTGKLDGNGKIITTSAPLFKNLKGEVKNLKITGSVTVSDYDVGALAQRADTATVTNVLNHASVTGSKTVIEEEYVFTNVSNAEGTLKDTKKLAGTAGLVGSATGVCAFTDCMNLGDINGSPAGGIVGVMGYAPNDSTFTFVSCYNEGKISDDGCSIAGEPNPQGENRGVAGIAGFAIDAKAVSFENCHNKGAIDGSYAFGEETPKAVTGGIFGYVSLSTNTTTNNAVLTIKDCTNEGAVKGSGQTGGVLGYNGKCTLKMSGCINKETGSVESTKSYVGGVVARIDGFSDDKANTSYLKDSANYATSFKVASGTSGAVCGYVGGKATVIENCTNYGDVNHAGPSHFGGVLGGGELSSSTDADKANEVGCTVYLNDCKNLGDITTNVNYATGGIVGNHPHAYIDGCINEGNISSPNGVQIGGIIGRMYYYGEIRNSINSGTITARNNDGSGRGASGGIAGYVNTSIVVENCKNTGDIICGDEACAGVVANVNVDITISGCENTGNVNATVSNGGVVGRVGGNATVTNCTNSGAITNTKNVAGGVVGHVVGNVSISGCSNSGAVTTATNYAGGVLAYTAAAANVTDSSNSGVIHGASSTGGVVGYATAASVVSNCNNTASIISTGNYVGGIAGYLAQNPYVTDCINTGEIKGVKIIGGIVGYFNNVGNDTETMLRCGNTGNVIGTGAQVGGLAGYVMGGAGDTNIKYCYNTGNVKGAYYVAGAIGYINTNAVVNVSYCFFSGVYTATDEGVMSAVIDVNNHKENPAKANQGNNYYVAGCADAESYYPAPEYTGERVVALNPNTTAEKLASGELAYTLNAAAKAADPSITEDIFYQTIGTDAHPVLDNTHKAVLKLADGTYANEIPEEPEVTTPEITTPEVTTPEVTTPEVTTPEETTPEVTTPEETTPEVTTPEVTTPEVTTPEETTPEVTTPAETTPAEPEPPIVGDSIATIIVVCAIAFVVIGAAVAMVVIKRKENN